MCVVIALTETGHRWVKYWRLGFEVLVGYLNGYPFLDFKKEGRARDTDLGIINIERVIYPMDIDLGEKEKWVGLGWVRGTRLESWPFIVFKWTGRDRRFSRGWSGEAQREKGESQESGYRQLCEELQRSQVRGGVKKHVLDWSRVADTNLLDREGDWFWIRWWQMVLMISRNLIEKARRARGVGTITWSMWGYLRSTERYLHRLRGC